MNYPNTDELTDDELREAYEHTKRIGPVYRRRSIEREIVSRWVAKRDEDDQ